MDTIEGTPLPTTSRQVKTSVVSGITEDRLEESIFWYPSLCRHGLYGVIPYSVRGKRRADGAVIRAGRIEWAYVRGVAGV